MYIKKKLSMNSSQERQNLIKSLYLESFPDVAKYIASKGGTLEEAREIFQEGVVQYYEQVFIKQQKLKKGDQAYLFGICRNLWHSYFHKSTRHGALEDYEFTETQPSNESENLVSYLQAAGQKCMDLLQSFYYEKLSMSQLASRFGFKSERSATVQKYKCLEKVRNEVKSKSLTYEDFIA